MASRKRALPKNKKLNPKFWVFCEGETEEAYVNYLKAKYRLPFKIIPRILGQNITKDLIDRHKIKEETHPKDKTYLMYDSDVISVLDRLQKIEGVVLLTSNPSIELWFLLHFKNQHSPLTTIECIHQLSNRDHILYKKGKIDYKLKHQLDSKQTEACKRAKITNIYKNPSTNIYLFIEDLELSRNLKQ